ncbi:MAG: hypothetical protein HOM97_00445 [Nitrospina sp.]|jgi:hypothetical protein|nr:hypothetical protein [Nitrospina sp.]
MSDLINKNGLSVANNSRSIHEEIFRGTGSVIGQSVSIFIQNETITEKYIVVFNDKTPASERRFVSSRFKEAEELFQQLLKQNASLTEE